MDITDQCTKTGQTSHFQPQAPDFLLVYSHWWFIGGLLKNKKISNKIVVKYRLFEDATNIHHPAPIENGFEEHQKI